MHRLEIGQHDTHTICDHSFVIVLKSAPFIPSLSITTRNHPWLLGMGKKLFSFSTYRPEQSSRWLRWLVETKGDRKIATVWFEIFTPMPRGCVDRGFCISEQSAGDFSFSAFYSRYPCPSPHPCPYHNPWYCELWLHKISVPVRGLLILCWAISAGVLVF